ncbi:MAG: ACT domain-containing protein, partial [Xenococcaceae cyanobacterium]
DRTIAQVSIVGAGMIGRPGIAAKMFATLSEAGVNIDMISTSEVKVSCVVDAQDCDRAIASLCKAFEVNNSAVSSNTRSISDRVRQEQKNANLAQSPPVRGIALDKNQARVAIRHVADRPGMAAKIFGLLAKNNISVDTIIQSQRCRIVNDVATRDIAFTVAQADAEITRLTLSELISTFGCGEVSVDPEIAKVSIVGSGMVGQPGVAARFFEALAKEQINIQMIATSEIKISCVVAQEDGIKALKTVHDAFGLAGSDTIEIPA